MNSGDRRFLYKITYAYLIKLHTKDAMTHFDKRQHTHFIKLYHSKIKNKVISHNTKTIKQNLIKNY